MCGQRHAAEKEGELVKGLLYKDFFLLRGGMIFMAVFQLVITGVCIMTGVCMSLPIIGFDRERMMMILAICYYLPFLVLTLVDQEIFVHDEHRAWIGFVGSTPQTIRGQVACKYYVILLQNLLLLLFCYLTDTIVVAVADDSMISMVLVGLIIFSLQLILQAIEMPFVLRFGTNVGSSVKGAVLAALVFLVICYGLFGDISFLFEEDRIASLREFVLNSGVIRIVAAIPYVAAATYYLSYRISVKIYPDFSEPNWSIRGSL